MEKTTEQRRAEIIRRKKAIVKSIEGNRLKIEDALSGDSTLDRVYLNVRILASANLALINEDKELDAEETKLRTKGRKDINGKVVKIGDRVKGFGTITCHDGFKIDLSPEVTVREENGVLMFGAMSASSFYRFAITKSVE